MATREKTVVFAFPMTTGTVADAVVTNLSQITVYLPESSKTFTSVFVEVGFQDLITATGGTITEHRCGLRLGAAGYTTITETDNITHSGENMAGVIGPFDFTSHFTTNWSGTSMTCDVQVYFDQSTGTTLGMTNVTALLYVTYTYDDNPATNATQIKTVRIPLESITGALTNTANSNFGTNQVPILTGGSGILCENSPVIRNYAFIIESNEDGQNDATDFTISVNIDSGTAFNFGLQERALVSDRFCRWIWHHSSPPTTTTTHNFQMWSSVTTRVNHPCVDLLVTYEFNASSTTRVLNSIQIPIEISSPLGVTTTAEASRFQREIYVQEPGTITLRQSAFRINYNLAASPTGMFWRAGSQAFRSYTVTGNAIAGMFCLQQRIDSGSAQGAGITLARGLNTLTLDGYATSTVNQVTNLMGYMTVNYESDLASGGIGQHAHTVQKVLLQWDAALTNRVRINNYAFSIPESNYWLMAAGFIFIQWVATASQAITFDVECLSGEGKGGGYYDIYADAYQSDAERACTLNWMRGRDVFRRFPQDTLQDRIDIETARDYRLFTSTTSSKGLIAVITYHSFTWTVGGTISGSNGVNDIVLQLIRLADKSVIQEQTVAHGTASYSFTVYNNTENFYVTARQSASNLGLTETGVAT